MSLTTIGGIARVVNYFDLHEPSQSERMCRYFLIIIHITTIFDALPNEGCRRFRKCLNSGDFFLRVEEDEIKSLVRHYPSYEETQFYHCLADLRNRLSI